MGSAGLVRQVPPPEFSFACTVCQRKFCFRDHSLCGRLFVRVLQETALRSELLRSLFLESRLAVHQASWAVARLIAGAAREARAHIGIIIEEEEERQLEGGYIEEGIEIVAASLSADK